MVALSASGTHAPLLLLFILSTLSPGPRWLSALQPWCLHSRQHDGGRKTREECKRAPQLSVYPSILQPSPPKPLLTSHRPESSHIVAPSLLTSCPVPTGEGGGGWSYCCCTCLANPWPVMTSPSTSTSRLSPRLKKLTEPC